ncbi:MAG: tetratricopeptide repeat protein [Alphaproteobacteria bacterium]|nr:tetratricopeptide repeat protein [Alphaproteobacteria bacterium]
MERRLAAILAADVVGYSRLMGEDEAGTLAALKALRTTFIEPLIAEHRGRIVKLMGDGFLVEFASVTDAVNCAIAWQKDAAERDGKMPLQFRIGINLGDIVIEDDDIYGNGVIIAARLEAIAEPGSVCVSSVVHDQVRRKLDESFSDLGVKELKNIDEPIRIFAWPAVISEDRTVQPAPETESLGKKSIAVLPFQNMSNDPDQEYFADGITEDIITTLSKIPGLAVIARNSTFVYKGKPISVKDVAAELGVRYVLEGSVRRGGNKMRITAQLIDATDASHIWAERYDRSVGEIFELQDEITRHIAVALQAELIMGDYAHRWQGGSRNFEAWEYKARGVHEFLKFTKEGMLKAKELFEKAIALEPGDEVTMASLGHCYDQLGSSNWLPDPEIAYATAQEWGERILAANPQSADAYVLLASVQRSRGQFDEAVATAEHALELAPNDSNNQAFMASSLIAAERLGEALKHIETAIRLNPIYPNWFGSTRVQAYRMTGRLDRALKAVTELVQRHPEYLPGLVLHAAVCAELDMSEKAKQAAQVVLERDPDFTISGYMTRVHFKNPTRHEDLVAALRKVGLP